MASCELCGRNTELVVADVEGVELQVCPKCAKYGTIKKRPLAITSLKPAARRPVEPEYTIIPSYASLLRTSREKKCLSQQDFAKFLNERESVVAKWEAGSLKPSIEIARKLEKRLGIKLVEVEEAGAAKVETRGKSDELTLGDLVKVRKRK